MQLMGLVLHFSFSLLGAYTRLQFTRQQRKIQKERLHTIYSPFEFQN